jgi:cobyrinic acid a,c-diamide synthase
VLVVDTRGITRGVAPLLLGYQAFDPEVRIAGVILNRVGGARHGGKLRDAVEHYTDLAVLGAVQNDSALEITERHLGLVPSNEASEAEAQIRRLAAAAEAQVDLDAVVSLARGAPALPAPGPAPPPVPSGDRVRIGVARDAAFGFYYADDLQALERAGAELVTFDALREPHLPEVDGLFLGGGFPETHARALAANASLRREIRERLAGGMPAYAECGGLMYLSREIRWGDGAHPMVGFIPGDTVMHARPRGRGYVQLRETSAHPWPSGGSPGAGEVTPAHEFHYSSLENLSEDLTYAYEVARGAGIDGRHDGLVLGNLLAGYAHLRGHGGNPWTGRFVDFVRRARAPGARAATATLQR